MPSNVLPFDQLKANIGEEWSAITQARKDAASHLSKLRGLIAEERPTANTSVVAFGSLARGEWTSGSDVDWTLLIDGPSDMRHFDVTKHVEEILTANDYKEPGATGTFGSMSSSHELVHHIGGLEDSNQNLTRRLLLFLESASLSDTITRDRVVSAILERYIIGDPPATSPGQFHVPLFLLNDVVRFWRTLAVDYATKKWQRANKGWAVRNIKLRLSRKLLFVKGMLVCMLCDPAFSGKPSSNDPGIVEVELLNLCKEYSSYSPIDLLSYAILQVGTNDIAKTIFGAYDQFLATLDDGSRRNELSELRFEQKDEGVFGEMRTVSRSFRDGINALFFEANDDLTKLTKRYGVF